jgi:hypothetical protein
MNDEVREKLGEIVARHGAAVAEDPRRCEALLRDYAGAHRREIFVLVSALEEGVAAELLGARGRVPPSLLVGQLARRLTDHLALSEEAARWAVESWVIALGLPLPEPVERQTAAPPAAPTPPVRETPPPEPPRPPARASTDVVVSPSGSGHFTTLGEAVARAPAGARIVVRPGVYDEALVLTRPVEIVAAGRPGEVVLRSSRASCVRMEADSATLRDLTIVRVRGAGAPSFAVDVARGELVLEGCDVSSESLACIAIHGAGTRPQIRRCVVRDGADAGIFAFDGATGLVEACDVRGNANVGVAIAKGASPRLVRCRIFDGKNAGVVSWDDGLGRLEDCEVFDNADAGIGASGGGGPHVERCRVYSNGNAGLYVHDGGLGEFSECEIFGHSEAEVAVARGGSPAVRGCRIHGGQTGVLVTDGGAGTFEACEITENAGSGVVIGASGGLVLRGCVIRGNGGVGVRAEDGASATLDSCDVRGNGRGPWAVDATSMLRAPGTVEE